MLVFHAMPKRILAAVFASFTALQPHASLSAPPAVPRVVENPDHALWDDLKPRKTFGLLEELYVGGDDPESDVVFGRISDIAVDSRGRILVLDGGFAHIVMYDPDSLVTHTFGRKGEGRGEFNQPTAIGIDSKDRIYVASMGGRIAVLEPNGEFFDEFRHEISDGFVMGLTLLPRGLYLVCLDASTDKLIHYYDEKRIYVRSFCDARSAVVKMENKNWGNGGSIDIGADGNAYFTQSTPYEIRKFSSKGELLLTVHRENNFIQPPRIERKGDSTTYYGFSGSMNIMALSDGRMLNAVLHMINDESGESETIMDLFDADGRLLKSVNLGHRSLIKCHDRNGRIYASEDRDVPTVVRYRVGFN